MTRKTLSTIITAIILGGLWFALPAAAQGNCDGSPDAPGDCPKPSDNDDTGAQNGPADPGGRFAVAWHKDSNNAWIAVNFPYLENAAAEAKDTCNEVMGGGCKYATWGLDSNIVVFRDNNGTVNTRWSFTREGAEREMRKDCKKRSVNCVVINSADSHRQTPPKVFSPTGNARSVYAAVARVGKKAAPAQASRERITIASGYATGKEAQSAALLACRENNKTKCTLIRTIADTFIIIGIDEKKGPWITSSLTTALETDQLKQYCTAKSRFCKVTGSFSALDKGIKFFDPYVNEQD